ncbi:hypothetical protein YC2023_033373 [Brassica napus]
MGVTGRVPPFLLWCAESECTSGSTMQVYGTRNCQSGPRSPGVPPELSKGRYGHVSTHLDNSMCPVIDPRVDGRITFFEIPSHPHPYTSTYSPAHREMEMEE